MAKGGPAVGLPLKWGIPGISRYTCNGSDYFEGKKMNKLIFRRILACSIFRRIHVVKSMLYPISHLHKLTILGTFKTIPRMEFVCVWVCHLYGLPLKPDWFYQQQFGDFTMGYQQPTRCHNLLMVSIPAG